MWEALLEAALANLPEAFTLAQDPWRRMTDPSAVAAESQLA
jgi:hypothetical protein